MAIKTLRPYPTALLNPCADPIFKSLFTQETAESKAALSGFLSAILGKTIKDVVLQPNEIGIETAYDRQTQFDLTCLADDEPINVEMQGINIHSSFKNRAEYHVAHLLNHYVMKNDNSSVLGERMNVIFLELPKIRRLPDDVAKLTEAELWGKFFTDVSNPEKKEFISSAADKVQGIKYAMTELEFLSQEEREWQRETSHWNWVSDIVTGMSEAKRKGLQEGLEQGHKEGLKQGHKEGIKQGHKEGLEQGKAQTKLEIAKKMKEKNIDLQTIFDVTGVSEKELED